MMNSIIKYFGILSLIAILTACDPANLTPIDGQRICDDVGYALSSRAFQCGQSSQKSNRLFTAFESQYNCDSKSVENELVFMGLSQVYTCMDSIRSTPCDSVLQWGDSLEPWLNRSSDCQILTTSASELEAVQIDSIPCPQGGRSLQLPRNQGAQIDSVEAFAAEGSSWSIGFWIKGETLPTRSGILGLEMEVSGSMSALIQDTRSAVQRIRIATGDYEGCAQNFPSQRLSIEIGNHSTQGTSGGLYEGESYFTDSVHMNGDWQYWLFVKNGVHVSLSVNGTELPLQRVYCNYLNSHSPSVDELSPWTTPLFIGALSDRGTMVRPSGLAFDNLSLWNQAVNHTEWDSLFSLDSNRVAWISMDTLDPRLTLPRGSKLEANCAE